MRIETTVDSYRPLLINNIFNYYGNNGSGSYNPFSHTNEGFEFLIGQNTHLVYEDGMVWGGFQSGFDGPKVGGSAYRHGLQPGRILIKGSSTNGPVADNPLNPAYRVFRVRPDVNPAVDTTGVLVTLEREEVPYIGRYENMNAHDILHQYLKDWNEWPAAMGAPYSDVDGDGQYNPAIDIPGQPGADETLWYVANDLDSIRAASFAGSPPIGLEVQKTIWAYKRNMGALTTSIFVRTILMNKSGVPIDSMFLLQWSDPDIGDAGDDFVGCDTTRAMGYSYNGNSVDAVYGASSPALGCVVLEGPHIPSPGNSALFLGRRLSGMANLSMGSFSFSTNGPWVPYQEPTSSADWYNVMNGLTIHGLPFIDPVTSTPTKFPLSGDPGRGNDGSIGWVDGMFGNAPFDRKFSLASGPFTMANGDTQETIVATIGAQGADPIASVYALKAGCDKVRESFEGLITALRMDQQDARLSGFALEQNYPNPFNPRTGIRGQWSGDSWVRLVVYDVLGREVAELANGRYPGGRYSFTFDGTSLASGVYFYRLTAGNF
ncbi:MAG: T9SS type A sorting domain-containing protein, partial [Bacteroidota bacterium]